MKADWDARARANARYYIATSVSDSEEEFERSGKRDAALFFEGLEDLLGEAVTLLDIGCGIGRMDRFLAPRVGKLIGLDVSGEMVRRARSRLADLHNVEFLEGDGWSLEGIGSASIDLVFSHIVFQHMPRKASAGYFEEALRVLVPGGHFLFQVPEVSDSTPDDPPEEDTFEMRFFIEADLRARLEEIGFAMRGCVRHPVVSEHAEFNQLRVHAQKPA